MSLIAAATSLSKEFWLTASIEHEIAFLVIVGGNEGQVKFYSDLSKTLDLIDNVHFTGRVPQISAKHYCKHASVLVSPRSDGTNTPLKIYEQLASGIPLVATNIYSHTQVLDDKVAFLVKPEPDDMAAGIIKALDQSNDCRISKNAMMLYKEKYDRPVYEKKIQRVLELLS